MNGFDALLGITYPTHVKNRYNVRSVAVTTPPSGGGPVTLAQAKLHLRVSVTDDDTLIQALIDSAQALVEAQTGCLLQAQQVLVTFDYFQYLQYLPVFPVVSVDNIGYYDETNTLQSVDLSTVVIDIASRPARISCPDGWPAVKVRPAAVQIACHVGYSTVPAPLISAMLLLIGDLYANREANGQPLVANPAVNALLFPYRSMEL